MLDQKYRVRVSRDPMLAGERQQARSKKLLLYGLIGGGIAVVVLVGLVLLGTRRKSAPEPVPGVAELKLTVERGEVQVKTADDSDFSEAQSDAVVNVGSTVRTEQDAIASLELSSGSVIRLDQSSRLEIQEIGESKLAARLVGGQAWVAIIGREAVRTPVTLETLEVRVEAGGSAYNVSHVEDQTTVQADSDAVSVTAQRLGSGGEAAQTLGQLQLDEGTQTSVSAKNLPESESDFDTEDIDSKVADSFWFRFNREKDLEFSQRLRGEEDTTEPELKITSPKDDAETDQDEIEVKGTTDISATVKVDGEPVDNNDGTFSSKIQLEEGQNDIVVTATDAAGNEAKVSLSVTRKKGKPAAVTLSVTSEEAGKVTLGWSRSETDAFAKYVIKRGGSAIKTLTDQSETSFTDTGLESGTEYVYAVCVVDSDEQESCSQEKSITPKSAPNQAPTVSISNPGQGASFAGGAAVSFAAAGADPESGELTYTWDFGDGVTTTGATASHTYAVVAAPQSYVVKVTVRDPSGATAEATVTITITP